MISHHIIATMYGTNGGKPGAIAVLINILGGSDAAGIQSDTSHVPVLVRV